MNKTWQKIWVTIVRWLLKVKTLNSILYALCIFFIRELTGISAGGNIQLFAENLKTRNPNSSFIEVFADLLIVFFSSGSKPILIITFATILLFLFVRFFDKINLHPTLKALGFIGLASVVFLSMYNLNFNPTKINTLGYEKKLKKVENIIANKPSSISYTSSYTEHIKKSNSNFTSFLQEFNDSLSSNPGYKGIAYVSAPAGFGKSFFIKKWLSEELPNAKIGKIKVRKDFVCEEGESNCFKDSLNYSITKEPDLIAESKNGKKALGFLYNYQFNLDSIIRFYKYDKKINVIIVDDLDEVSQSTMNRYLKDFKSIIVAKKYPDLSLVVFLSRPEAYVSYLSNIYRKETNGIKTYGLEENSLQKPVFSSSNQIMNRINDWSDWYQDEKLGRSIKEMERNQIFKEVYSLYKKYDFIKLHIQIQSNSHFLFRGILNRKINANTNEKKIKKNLFELMVGRNSDSHLRPMLDSYEGAIYIAFLKEIVLTKINIDEIEENNGWFTVKNNDPVSIDIGGIVYTTTVKSILNRSGLITIDPKEEKNSKYKFEPFWIHRHILMEIEKD